MYHHVHANDHITTVTQFGSTSFLASTRISRSETGPEFASSSSTSTPSSVQSPAPLFSPPPHEQEGHEAQGRAEQLLQTRAEDAVSLSLWLFQPCHRLFSSGENLPTIHCSRVPETCPPGHRDKEENCREHLHRAGACGCWLLRRGSKGRGRDAWDRILSGLPHQPVPRQAPSGCPHLRPSLAIRYLVQRHCTFPLYGVFGGSRSEGGDGVLAGSGEFLSGQLQQGRNGVSEWRNGPLWQIPLHAGFLYSTAP